ncbi:MAG: peptidylprolyl isomerase [Pseudomonadales bacterium]|nr:peptidylprolyl isomerase [Pseudomonadales bacterium]MCP5345863.1 peptidylprolyl isomerase [Pseudomonadales bacterium]
MNKQIKSLLLCAAVLLVVPLFAGAQPLMAVIDTDRGVMEVELNERAAPTTVASFVNLALRGFYDGLTFHRVERNFMVQGGDPLGNGTGGPGYRFRGETILHHNRAGIVSMANSGPGTDGSQFFVTHVATPHLDGLHSVFGRVTSGLDTVYAIRRGDVINSITIVGDPMPLLERKREQLAEWNAVLDANFPDLKPAPLSGD